MEPNGKHHDETPPLPNLNGASADPATEGTAATGTPDETPADISSHRYQLWASLRALRPEIERLAAGHLEPNERGAQLVVLLARIVCAEMDFRLKDEEAGVES